MAIKEIHLKIETRNREIAEMMMYALGIENAEIVKTRPHPGAKVDFRPQRICARKLIDDLADFCLKDAFCQTFPRVGSEGIWLITVLFSKDAQSPRSKDLRDRLTRLTDGKRWRKSECFKYKQDNALMIFLSGDVDPTEEPQPPLKELRFRNGNMIHVSQTEASATRPQRAIHTLGDYMSA